LPRLRGFGQALVSDGRFQRLPLSISVQVAPRRALRRRIWSTQRLVKRYARRNSIGANTPAAHVQRISGNVSGSTTKKRVERLQQRAKLPFNVATHVCGCATGRTFVMPYCSNARRSITPWNSLALSEWMRVGNPSTATIRRSRASQPRLLVEVLHARCTCRSQSLPADRARCRSLDHPAADSIASVIHGRPIVKRCCSSTTMTSSLV
jgi:hypothetical protein